MHRRPAVIAWSTQQSVDTYAIRQKGRPRMKYKRICRVAAKDSYDGVVVGRATDDNLPDNNSSRRGLGPTFARAS
jgi:hypothetical protein